jgi:dimethylglycine dehydrogenase
MLYFKASSAEEITERFMKTHTQVVVIGGGLIGCSILYHLTKLGWSDVMLLERSELTSGSTWHAAAGIHGLHDNSNITRIQNYTMNLYKELEAETGQGFVIFSSNRKQRAPIKATRGKGEVLWA